MLRAAGADGGGGTYGHYGAYGQYNVDTHRGIPTQDTSYLTGRGFGANGITVGDYEAAATARDGGLGGYGGMGGADREWPRSGLALVALGRFEKLCT